MARALAQVHDRNGRLGLDPSLFHAPELFGSGRGGGGGFLAEAAADLGEKELRKNDAGAPAGAVALKARSRARAVRRARQMVHGGHRAATARRASAAAAPSSLGVAPEHHVTVTRGRVFDDACIS